MGIAPVVLPCYSDQLSDSKGVYLILPSLWLWHNNDSVQLPREQLNMQMECIRDLKTGSSVSQTKKIKYALFIWRDYSSTPHNCQSVFRGYTCSSYRLFITERSPKMWSHCFMGLKGHQQEEEDTSDATMFALMLTPEAKWWPSCLRSVSVCEKVIKIIIVCCCQEEAWTTCARRGSSAGEKTGRFWLSARWGPVRSGLKGYRIHLKEGEKDYLQSSHLPKSLSNPSTSHLSSHVQQRILTRIGLITMLARVLYCLAKAYLIRCSWSSGSVHQFADSASKID